MSSRPWAQKALAEISQENFDQICTETGLSPITIKVCLNRGLGSAVQISEFLNPRLDLLVDPYLIRDMNKAVDRLVVARENGESIRIFGDYDVDGTTGSALLFWVFREFGYQATVRQPDRFKDGYGLNVGAVVEAVADGAKLLVTVDCGISSFEAALKAKELGIDLIVIDHHQIDVIKGIPEAHAVVNPQRADCESGLKQLCGCGLAFYVARALRTRGRELGWWPAGAEPNLKKHLDLVVMATAADMVPLTGDNHVLVRHGLDVLKYSRKPGVRALLAAAGLDQKEFSSSHLGFTIGPRINASGRMGSAVTALELLTTEDEGIAKTLALDLETKNKERADIQNAIWDEVKAQVEDGIKQGKFKNSIVVASDSWHEGVVGIVASRVTETFHKPAIVIALREDYGKGSARSFGGKDILAGLRECSAVLKSFGGHRFAAGVAVEFHHFDAFVTAFDDAMEKVLTDSEQVSLHLEGECSLQDLSISSLLELEKLGPFGPGNPEPLFQIEAEAVSHRVLKERHLKFELTDSQTKTKTDAIWFFGLERIREGIPESEKWVLPKGSFVVVPEINRFRGKMTPSLRIKDFKHQRDLAT